MQKILLLKKRRFFMRNDILSFAITFGALVPLVNNVLNPEFLYLKFFMILAAFFNSLFFLITETNAKYRAKHRFIPIKDINEASHVQVIKKNKYKKTEIDVLPLVRSKIEVEEGIREKVIFFFR